jgi:uncharacterized protein (TIGR04255 family)
MKYEKDYITNVICKFNFEEIRLDNFPNIESDFWIKISKKFTDRKVKEMAQHVLKYENGVSVTEVRTIPVFEYSNDKLTLTLGHDSMSFECEKYFGFGYLNEEIKQIISDWCNVSSINKFSRLGLRYINKFFFLERLTLLLRYFNPLLSNVGKFLIDEKEVSRQAGQIIFNMDDFKVVMVYGLINPDFPSRIVKNEFVLDYDCMTSSIEYNSINSTLNEMHGQIIRLFEKSITNKLRKKMGARDE